MQRVSVWIVVAAMAWAGLSPGQAAAQSLPGLKPASSLGSAACPEEIEARLKLLAETQPNQAAEVRRLLCPESQSIRPQDLMGKGAKPRVQPGGVEDLQRSPLRPGEGPVPEAPASAERGLSALEGFFAKGEVEGETPVEQFGYDLFSREPGRFVPAAAGLVGPDYLIGPDDEFTVTIWGLVDAVYSVVVSREGTVVFPRVGEVRVAGIPYGQLKGHMEKAFSRHYKNFNLSVAMGQLRSIQVYVVGEVRAPGSYTMHALSTIFTALFASGGPKKTGTLREIQLLRNGKVVNKLDLYEFLLRGDKSKDVRVLDQDTVFVPLIGPVVGVAGQVQRPAIYELNGPATAGDLLVLAGGVKPTSYLTRLQIERVVAHEKRVTLDFDNDAFLKLPAQNMDRLRVFAINAAMDRVVYLKGHVVRPGSYQYRPGMRVADLIGSLADLKPNAFLKAELSRYGMGEGRVLLETKTIDLAKSLGGDPEQNVELKEHDVVVVRPIPPSDIGWEVTLKGEVKRPGLYTIMRGERLSSVLNRAGGLTAAAYPKGAIFIRQSVRASEEAQIQKLGALQSQRAAAESSALAVGGLDKGQMDAQKELLTIQRETPQQLTSQVTLGRMVVRLESPEKLEGTPDDILLENGDSLEIPSIPQTVSVLGSVRNPTALHYRPGLDPREYLSLAGGPTPDADLDGAFVLRADGTALALGMGRNGSGSYGGDGKSPAGVMVVERGDAIVVPTRIEVRTRPAPMWQAVPDPSEATRTPQPASQLPSR
jgi:polysaccharide export outer membrane protein